MQRRSLSTRERDARLLADARALVKEQPPLALVPQVKADTTVVQVPTRPRIVFLEVVRDDFDTILGLRPHYEGE